MPLMDVPPDDARGAEIVRDGHDDIAEQYLADASRPTPHPRHEWVALLCDQLAEPGLRTAHTLVAAGHSVLGVDLSPRQIALASEVVPQGRFVVGDAMTVDFEHGAFDAVVMPLLERVQQWLRPGGWMLVNFGTKDSPAWLEENFLGYGATSWTNGWDAETNPSLVAESGFTLSVVSG